MIRIEFTAWLDDFSARFPATGEWIDSMSRTTADIWFDDVLSMFTLEDCIEANRRMMRLGDFKTFDRERIPAIIAGHCGDIQSERATAKSRAEDKQKHIGTESVFHGKAPTDDLRCLHQSLHIGDRAYRKNFIDDWFDGKTADVVTWAGQHGLALKASEVGRHASKTVQRAAEDCLFCREG